MSKLCRLLMVFLGSFLLSISPSYGQQTLGSINGNVTDVSGAAVSKASIKVRNVATNLEETVSSKDDGSFSVSDLPIGTYEVKISRDGFKTEIFPQILVQANRTTTVNASRHL